MHIRHKKSGSIVYVLSVLFVANFAAVFILPSTIYRLPSPFLMYGN